MSEIGKWLLALAVVVGGVYWGVNSLLDRGAALERAATAAASAKASKEAHDRYVETLQAIDDMRAAEAAKAAQLETDLERLRHERENDADSSAVVFDDRWAQWLRGSAPAPRD